MQQALRKATSLLNDLEQMEHRPKAYEMIRELRRLLTPPPTMREICERLPGHSVIERAAALGISRQAMYMIEAGRAKPKKVTLERIAKLSGVPAEVIRSAAP